MNEVIEQIVDYPPTTLEADSPCLWPLSSWYFWDEQSIRMVIAKDQTKDTHCPRPHNPRVGPMHIPDTKAKKKDSSHVSGIVPCFQKKIFLEC
jgi:hypothetical protein